VIQATENILHDYVKEQKQEDLVVWPSRPVSTIGREGSSGHQRSAGACQDMGEKELTLSGGCAPALAIARLDNHKDLDIALQRMLSIWIPTRLHRSGNEEAVRAEMQGNLTASRANPQRHWRDMLMVVTPIRGSPPTGPASKWRSANGIASKPATSSPRSSVKWTATGDSRLARGDFHQGMLLSDAVKK